MTRGELGIVEIKFLFFLFRHDKIKAWLKSITKLDSGCVTTWRRLCFLILQKMRAHWFTISTPLKALWWMCQKVDFVLNRALSYQWKDQISFDVSSSEKVVFSGVAAIVYQDSDVHGAKFLNFQLVGPLGGPEVGRKPFLSSFLRKIYENSRRPSF